MKLQFTGRLILAICISLSLIACNSNDKKAEKTATTDTTKKETIQPVTNMGDMDAVKVAPNLYKVVKDTMGIRMVEADYQPGDSSALHSHPDYAIYVVEGGTVTFYAKDGSKMENVMSSGMTLIKPAEFHSVKNTGKTPIKVMLVEVNRAGAMSTPDASLDATKVSPELYKLKNDTMGIRVIEVNYKPGQISGLHSHPDAALYVINPGTGEFSAKDGSKRVLNMEKGMSMIVPADTHTVKNTGKTTMKAILVEVNRAMK